MKKALILATMLSMPFAAPAIAQTATDTSSGEQERMPAVTIGQPDNGVQVYDASGQPMMDRDGNPVYVQRTGIERGTDDAISRPLPNRAVATDAGSADGKVIPGDGSSERHSAVAVGQPDNSVQAYTATGEPMMDRDGNPIFLNMNGGETGRQTEIHKPYATTVR